MTDNKLTSLCLIALLGIFSPMAHAQWQSVESIRVTALNFAKQKIHFPDARMDFHVGVLDTRHRLPNCSVPLQGFLSPQTRLDRDTVVGVRCSGRKPWKVYVPIQIVTFKTVFVTQRPIPKGSQLTKDDLREETRNVNGRDYISDLGQFNNKQVRRDLPAGTLVTQKMLFATKLIKRGQTVTLLSKNKGLSVRISGEALESGILDQRIRVRNSSSKREVEGIVRSGQIVEIML